jgi:hypothetical protein
MPPRKKPGDIFEIKIKRGLAYFIYTHENDKRPNWGSLIRIFQGTYKNRPQNLSRLLAAPIQFSLFFPLGAAFNRGIVAKAGTFPVPPSLKKFPVFKLNSDPKALAINPNWWLWDGTNEWKTGTLTEEEKKYPYLHVVNDSALKWYIESGWTEDKDLGPAAAPDVEKAMRQILRKACKSLRARLRA